MPDPKRIHIGGRSYPFMSPLDLLRYLCALDEARRNGHWHELWHDN